MCKYCNQKAIENELHFALDCLNYEEITKDTLESGSWKQT